MKNYNCKYVVRLTTEEREQLSRLVNTGRVAAHRRRRAQVLFLADAGPEGSGADGRRDFRGLAGQRGPGA